MSKIEKILVVDDDPISNMVCAKVIKSVQPATQVDTCLSAREGLDYLEKSLHRGDLPDMILLDINMPVMDGWGFLDTYRKKFPELASRIRLFMYSSSVYEEDTEKASSYDEVSGYIVKPLSAEKIGEIQEVFFSV